METVYNQLAQSLRNNIISGKWPDGRKLETERELCNRYGFSRITVRRALLTLEEENLIVRRQGLGTFVSIRPRRKIPIVHGDYSRSIRNHAPNVKRRLVEKKQLNAGKDLARQLGMPPGDPVVTARRLDILDNHTTAMDEVVMPLRYADQLSNADWEAVDFVERWQQRQHLNLDYESQTIEALPASGAVLKWLAVKPGYPLLVETNFIYLPGGQVAAKFTTYYSHKHYQFNSVDRDIAGHSGVTEQVVHKQPSVRKGLEK